MKLSIRPSFHPLAVYAVTQKYFYNNFIRGHSVNGKPTEVTDSHSNQHMDHLSDNLKFLFFPISNAFPNHYVIIKIGCGSSDDIFHWWPVGVYCCLRLLLFRVIVDWEVCIISRPWRIGSTLLVPFISFTSLQPSRIWASEDSIDGCVIFKSVAETGPHNKVARFWPMSKLSSYMPYG